MTVYNSPRKGPKDDSNVGRAIHWAFMTFLGSLAVGIVLSFVVYPAVLPMTFLLGAPAMVSLVAFMTIRTMAR